ncbi:MAG: phosphoadenylyl-sulfate reductase [Bacteroidetes bacterium]|nr:MAG: phosphoadenylyl-sulfate reductase [Bacteroidota bacterium]
MSLELLNDIFEQLTFEERLRKLYNYFDEDEILVTSSFGTQSVFLLHLIHKIRPTQKIYFIDTTFHFEETLAYKKQLVEQYNLQVVDIRPPEAENRLTREEAWWKDHPRMCCTINKVAPLEPIKAQHKIWVSGLMAYQTPFRATLDIFAQQGDIIKFHPLIDIDEGEFLFYLDKYKLPRHPLEAKGYGSVGCAHCTKPAAGREGRWAGTKKTECGLHPGFFNRKKKKG